MCLTAMCLEWSIKHCREHFRTGEMKNTRNSNRCIVKNSRVQPDAVVDASYFWTTDSSLALTVLRSVFFSRKLTTNNLLIVILINV